MITNFSSNLIQVQVCLWISILLTVTKALFIRRLFLWLFCVYWPIKADVRTQESLSSLGPTRGGWAVRSQQTDAQTEGPLCLLTVQKLVFVKQQNVNLTLQVLYDLWIYSQLFINAWVSSWHNIGCGVFHSQTYSHTLPSSERQKDEVMWLQNTPETTNLKFVSPPSCHTFKLMQSRDK